MPKTKKTSKRKPNPAFMKPVQPDDKLAAVVGSHAAFTAGAYKKALGNTSRGAVCRTKRKES